MVYIVPYNTCCILYSILKQTINKVYDVYNQCLRITV